MYVPFSRLAGANGAVDGGCCTNESLQTIIFSACGSSARPEHLCDRLSADCCWGSLVDSHVGFGLNEDWRYVRSTTVAGKDTANIVRMFLGQYGDRSDRLNSVRRSVVSNSIKPSISQFLEVGDSLRFQNPILSKEPLCPS